MEVNARGYLREDLELVNAEALTHIASIAMDESLHPDGITFRGEPTLWDLGADTETLLLLIRSMNVARGEMEDSLFGSAKDPGMAMMLPNLPVLPVVDEEGNKSMLATASTQQMINYIENIPHEISQYELREQGFVTNVHGILSDNVNRFDFFMETYCSDFPGTGLCGYPLFDPSGTGLGFANEDFLWAESKEVSAGEGIPNGGGLGDDVLLLGTATKEGDWILYGILAYEDGFVMIRDISRDEYRSMSSAEYSVRMFEHLVYKESAVQSQSEHSYVDYTVILTNESSDAFSYENLPEIHWELYSGYRLK
ncbi:MAG: hypothetical protein J6S45_04700 [Firmicutes bacterium]|nr:hypothetical protein [Bacillota bacterium]